MLKYTEARDEDVLKLKSLASANGKIIEELAAAQKAAAKNKDFETAKMVSEQVKWYKSYDKALGHVRFVLVNGSGHIPSEPPELYMHIRMIELELFG